MDRKEYLAVSDGVVYLEEFTDIKREIKQERLLTLTAFLISYRTIL